jgi:hypothetical protein
MLISQSLLVQYYLAAVRSSSTWREKDKKGKPGYYQANRDARWKLEHQTATLLSHGKKRRGKAKGKPLSHEPKAKENSAVDQVVANRKPEHHHPVCYSVKQSFCLCRFSELVRQGSLGRPKKRKHRGRER